MKQYQDTREGYVTEVTVDRRPLNPRLDLWNQSPSGFEWGYGGSGPAQLALALLADYLGNDEEAVRLHQDLAHCHRRTFPPELDAHQRRDTAGSREIENRRASTRRQTGRPTTERSAKAPG